MNRLVKGLIYGSAIGIGLASTHYISHKNPILSDLSLSIKKNVPSVTSMHENEHHHFSNKFDYIIVGAGSSGCITAYFLAKWMQDYNIPGNVLLIDSGDDYFKVNGPKPDLWSWYENWCNFSVLHDTTVATTNAEPGNSNDSFSPAIASTHNGVGGCSTHDTRITFIPTTEQSKRMADTMKWSLDDFNMYIQAALDMMPLHTTAQNERFYDDVLKTLTDYTEDGARSETIEVRSRSESVEGLQSLQEYKAEIINDSIGYVSVAMYPDELRWTCAYLLHDSIRPKNLTVLANTEIDKVLFNVSKYSNFPDTYDIRMNQVLEYKIITGTGVLTSNGKEIKLKNDSDSGKTREIIIAAGSLGTPAILQRSGLGDSTVLNELGIPVIVDDKEIGHGVDHMEVPVMYSLLDKYLENSKLPRGGPMAWPIALFFKTMDESSGIMAHFGTSGPPYGDNVVIGTPNCSKPDYKAGFYANITTRDPHQPIQVKHINSETDFKVLALGVRKMVNVFDHLKTKGIVGDRFQPTGFDIDNDQLLDQYIRNNLGTAYHWMSTVKAGHNWLEHPVNVNFKVRSVSNLRVGSGAVLPEIPGANPHLTITGFSIALAHEILKETFSKRNDTPPLPLPGCSLPVELRNAKVTLLQCNGKPLIRRFGEELPKLHHIAKLQQNLTNNKN